MPLLKALDANAGSFWYSGDIQILRARGQLGDFMAARPLMELRNNPWSHRMGAAEQGLTALEAAAGSAEALAATLFEPENLQEQSALRQVALHDHSAAVRRWALDRLGQTDPEQSIDLWLNALGSEDWNEQRAASLALLALPSPPLRALQEQVAESLFSDQQRGWAALTLRQLGHEVDLSGFQEPRVPLPPQVAPDLRNAIVRAWASRPAYAQQGTDVRWLLEGYGQELPELKEEGVAPR
ncbi:hypothetical protein ACFP81_13695 [Deinococcus lacus]|uniref:HEAT repeat domain-containing protein n=1 Tax=Deinococcus lacus TaxID=392561 RepID=A0ABW1YF27_9DEIO